ncbi:hypothetical protein GCM10022225_84340 [Plantactinospora mayteni]|uniref:Uncharacterized protein n=1 Tax=Plantactinospora mayteni TaxID=566021 RepID=A0ABQ4F3U9_9ACTN|nr:hypothetical protein [Plantactinospora mayteni]GIH01568.1 hypothetical protein Pma05_81400 [Plantactinospora mayteni]
MTALPNSVPADMPRPNPFIAAPNIHGDAILVGGDVPIAVWRLDDRDDDASTTDPNARLASRLAQRLILVYTRRGDAVIDFDSDTHLQTASANTFRSYLPITEPGDVADLNSLAEPVSLVVLRWPPQHTDRTRASIADLFGACRLIMTADTCAIAAISSAAPDQPGTTYAEHLNELLPAARAAGLTHVLQIVAVTGPGNGDQFVYYATRAEAEAARQDRPTGHRDQSFHVDLMVFTAPGVATAESNPTPADRDPQRLTRQRHDNSRDVTRIAEIDVATRSTDDGESSYGAAAPTSPTSRNDRNESQSEVRAERTPNPCPPYPRSTASRSHSLVPPTPQAGDERADRPRMAARPPAHHRRCRHLAGQAEEHPLRLAQPR